MQKNTNKLNKIINDIYKVFSTKCCERYLDTDWHNVHDCAHLINYINGVENVNLSSGKYYNYFDNDGDRLPYRDYELEIKTAFGYIEGLIRCCSAGTIKDPFSSYDIIISVWKNEEKNKNISESLDMSIFEIKDMLKNDPDFKEIKKIIKKAFIKGITISTVLTAIFCTFSLTNQQAKELKQYTYSLEIQKEDATYLNIIEPDWEFVTNNVETTIYHATKQQCDNTPNITASGFKLNMDTPQLHKIIAMERTMMKKYGLKYGDIVLIEGTDGLDDIYQIQDTMNKRFKNLNKIDILVGNDIKTGKWNNVTLYKLKNKNECIDNITNSMLDAINQDEIDKRQKHS